MIAYVKAIIAHRGRPGLRERVASGTWGDTTFTVSTVDDGTIIVKRSGKPAVEVEFTDLVHGVLVAHDAEIEAGQTTWQPLTRRTHAVQAATGETIPLEPGSEMWGNDLYSVLVYRGPVTHLSYHRVDRAPIRDWRHAQNIKNDICGPDSEAVELYPAEDRLVDMSNQYHLWVIPAGDRFPFGFDEGRQVMSADETEATQIGAKQR